MKCAKENIKTEYVRYTTNFYALKFILCQFSCMRNHFRLIIDTQWLHTGIHKFYYRGQC